MTTIIPTPTLPTIDIDGTTLIGDQPNRVKNRIDYMHTRSAMKPFVVKARGDDGVGSLGMYCEVIHRNPMGHASRHTRYFVYGNKVYAASRPAGESKANWKSRTVTDVKAALDTVQAALNREGSEQFGRIILVEMTADDISAIESGQVPGARFRGQYRNEKDFGKFDFGKIRPGVPVKRQDMSTNVKSALSHS